MRVFLFDIDGTLILSGYAGGRSFDEVFYNDYGIKNAMKGIIPDGKTDPQIAREIFQKKLCYDPGPEELKKTMERYLSYLKEKVWNPNYQVIPGVEEVLHLLYKQKNSLLGLATGNIEEGSKVKLAPSNLWKYFVFGAFGSDSEDREEILSIAIKRAKKICSRKKEKMEKVFVIGDTPLDIKAAKAVGVLSCAFATGNYTISELKKHKPDYVFQNFLNKKKILKVFLSN